MGVRQILERSTTNTVELLKTELEIRKGELQDAWHMGSLEKIFIENRIYLLIEECETWECVIKTIDKGLDPWKKLLKRHVTEDDITRLTEIKIKRISKFDAFKAENIIKSIEIELVEVQNHLDNLIEFAIDYFKSLKKKYGKDKKRKTEIRSFDNIEATKVVVANEKLYVNYDEGFIGTGLKKDEFLFECSDINDVIIIRKDGTYVVTKVSHKAFVGKNILYVGLFKKNDSRTIYNIVYRDGRIGNSYMKRFPVKGVTRDKEYDLTQGNENSKILYFSANPNGEAEVIRINLKHKPKLKKANFEYDFSELAIKNRNANGNILTKHSVLKISLKEKGVSTLGGRKIWFDSSVHRLNADKRGIYLGEYSGNDRIIVITSDGKFRFTNYDLSNHFEDTLLIIEKFNKNDVYSVIFYDADQEFYYLKRFQLDGHTNGKMQSMVGENADSKMILLTKELLPQFKVHFGDKNADREDEIISAAEFITLKSFKARGKRITTLIKKYELTTPADMIIWKCGSSCAGHSDYGVKKWIQDVGYYFEKVIKN
jgi:topoisomerase-4 subunit A